MPRKKPKLVVVADRVAEATRIVADQHELIVTLKASGPPTGDAEKSLQSHLSALKHLEGHERKVRKEDEAKKRESKKDRRFRIRTSDSAN